MNQDVANTEAKSQLVAGANPLAIEPQSLEETFRLATAVHKGGLAPKEINTVEKCLIAIMTGMELGLPPMQAIQSIAVINGRPTLWGDGLLAIVQRSPLCQWIEEDLVNEGTDQMVAVCRTMRTGRPNPIERGFSVGDAKKAKLWNKSGPWETYPKRMLQMRARAFCLRDAYPDLLKGMQIREEVEDYGPDSARDITPPAPRPSLSERLKASGAQAKDMRQHIDRETGEIFEHTGQESDGAIPPDATPTDSDAGGEDDSTPSIFFPDPPADIDKLREYAKTMYRATSDKGLQAHHIGYFGPDDIVPPLQDEMSPWTRVFQAHLQRVNGTIDKSQCGQAIKKILEELRQEDEPQ